MDRNEATGHLNRYSEESNKELNLILNYVNIYVAIMATILAATLAALFGEQFRPGWMLLSGPVLLILLSMIGWLNTRIFYRRFLEAWIAKINLEYILGLRVEPIPDDLGRPRYPNLGRPRYPNKCGGFIPDITHPSLRKIFQDSKSSEGLISKLERSGRTSGTRFYLLSTFILFGVIGVILFLGVAYVVFSGATKPDH